MLFSSISFLYFFLPCVLIVYFAAPQRVKNLVLLIFSLVFYGWGEPVYVLLMLLSIVVAYFSGLWIEKSGTKRAKKWAMGLGVSIALSFLLYFKYTDFFIENFNRATGLSIPLLRLALPIGISFYTFQIVSYIIDAYRGTVAAQRDPIALAAYVTMFPQLIAGPIVRYSDINAQLTQRRHTLKGFSDGVGRFVLGLGKKVLIANSLGALCQTFRASSDLSVLYYWMYAVAFALQIYFDFSGYSDMAIGLGKMFGFNFLENFNYPFISASITEFWRRWHMSLSSWFRDYVYIPLGGNRVSKSRWVLNILTVWMLTGFWHGAEWNFILWGLFFAAVLLMEKLFLLKHLEKHKVLSHLYVLPIILVSFVLFNATSLSEAWNDISSMFGRGNLPFISAEAIYYLRSYLILFLIAIAGATPLPKLAIAAMQKTKAGDLTVSIAAPVVLVLLLLLATAYLVDGSFNPFLYFRF
ncbi:MAG: MBOAT family protein [Ruminococcaceae bacterium]|nr:MBOAT family protein [Oscillospiraceae bacterium]